MPLDAQVSYASPMSPAIESVAIITFRMLDTKTQGISVPVQVREALGWVPGDRIVLRATDKGNLLASRVELKNTLTKNRKR